MIFARFALVGVVAAFLLSGCAAEPIESVATSTPSAEEPAPRPTWIPDLTVVRDFGTDDGTTTCTIVLRVVEPSGASDELAARVEAARAFLSAGDWSAVAVSLDDFDADDLASRRAQGVSDAELLSMQVQDRIYEDLKAAGLFGEGVSTESRTDCDA
jgi:hypothetical protein